MLPCILLSAAIVLSPLHDGWVSRFALRRTKLSGIPQILRGMDLYAGAGGLGYLDHMSLLEEAEDGTCVPDPNG